MEKCLQEVVPLFMIMLIRFRFLPSDFFDLILRLEVFPLLRK